MLAAKTLQEFLDETASNSPAPGGGSVSALAASLGLALISMVCRLTIGKKKYFDVQAEMESTLKKSEELRLLTTIIIDEDTSAFNKVMAAFALPKETEEQKAERSTAILDASKGATLVPLKLTQLCAEAIPLAKVVAEKGNVNSLSDSGVAAAVLRSACEGAAMNVRINLAGLNASDAEFVEKTSKTLETSLTTVRIHAETILAFVNSKI